MDLRNRTMSKGHLQNPRRYFLQQVPSPASTEAETSSYKVTAIFLVYNLMVSGILISPAEQNFQLLLQNSPVKSPSFSRFPNKISTESPSSLKSSPSATEFYKSEVVYKSLLPLEFISLAT